MTTTTVKFGDLEPGMIVCREDYYFFIMRKFLDPSTQICRVLYFVGGKIKECSRDKNRTLSSGPKTLIFFPP